MSLIPQIPQGQLCERCKLHKATLVTSDSVTDWAHGFLKMLCECCHLDVQVKRVEDAMSGYAKLLTDLQAACRDEPPFDPQALVAGNAKLREEALAQWTAAHYGICGRHYPAGEHAMNHAGPHPEGEWCYWPRPDILGHPDGEHVADGG